MRPLIPRGDGRERRRVPAAAVVLCLATAGCAELYPEVIVVNEIDETVLVRDLSFSGCLWTSVLAFGEASSPGRCLPGEDRVHFTRLDAAAHCREQVEGGTIPEPCSCDPEDASEDDPLEPGLVNETPHWFAYQTLTVYRAGPGDVLLVRLSAEDMEQDFSVPGPYGH